MKKQKRYRNCQTIRISKNEVGIIKFDVRYGWQDFLKKIIEMTKISHCNHFKLTNLITLFEMKF